MPILHRSSPEQLQRIAERKAIYTNVVGVESKGLGKLQYAYREGCYGGEELQFRVRKATHRWSPLGDGGANTELRKLGLVGENRAICPTCFITVSAGTNACECSDPTSVYTKGDRRWVPGKKKG